MTQAPAQPVTGAESILWDLSVLYAGMDDPRIESDMEALRRLASAFVERYRGKLASLSASELRSAMAAQVEMAALQVKLGTYASLNFTTYSTDPAWGAFMQRMREFGADIHQQTVFFDLEWNLIDDAQAEALLADPALESYRYRLMNERRHKPYQLSEPEEKVLIQKQVTSNAAWTRLFEQIMGAMQVEFDGQKLPMPQVLSRLYDADREVRRRAADSITAALQARRMELTYIFNVLAADKAADDRMRGYPSWITARNLSNKAPDAVVEALIQAVTANYELVARHYRVKRVLLGYDELYDYDRYAPLPLKESDAFYPWEEAKRIVLDAYSSFSPRIGMIAARFFDERWIHAPVAQGKRGGAYASYGTKSTHPFVFLNYTGKVRDVMTLAHELGHGVHMYLASEVQDEIGRYTPLTTAEMASVFGEMIVFQDLLAKEQDAQVRLSMLCGKLEDSFATVFRQTAMNRFEDAMHNGRRSEGELSTERLTEMWLETQNAMFLKSVTLRDDYGLWWSYVPHFLNTPGYVYAYAFGELLVLALYNIFQREGSSFVPKYEALLAAGDSDDPDHLLAQLGVNLNDPAFWNEGIAAIRTLVEEEEELARQIFPERFPA